MVDTITTDLAPVPSRSAPATFSSRMDTWLGKISTWTTEANTLATGANTDATTASTQAGIATTQAGLATTNGAIQVGLAADQVDLAEEQVSLAAAQVALAAGQVDLAADQVDLAEDWATKTDSTVDGTDYSAKYHAISAADSAQTALLAPGTSATSTTSLLIGTGSKNLIIQTGKAIVEGMFVVIANTGTSSNYMAGQVTSYASGTGELIVNVIAIGGSGTLSSWVVSLSALPFDSASTAEMEAGTETSIRSMSPANIMSAITANPTHTDIFNFSIGVI